MMSTKKRCLIRSKTGYLYPSGALVTMGFWQYFQKSNAHVFRKESLCRFIVNSYLYQNSHTWVPQDLLVNIRLQVNRLLDQYGFGRRDQFYTRPLYLDINQYYTLAKTKAETIELEYRSPFHTPPSPASELHYLLNHAPKRYLSHPAIVEYFDVGVI